MIHKHLICYLLLSFLFIPTHWSQERAIRPLETNNRQALVIGNANYEHAGVLRNPANDAQAIGDTLEELGFRVTTLTEANKRQMDQAIRKFGKDLRNSNGVGLFYYAGHGMQIDGENYLLPTDINPSNETDVSYDAVPVGKLLGQMKDAGNGMNVVILDACRNNPFARSFRSGSRGLAQVIAPAGSFISYATAPGDVAADGEGDNGLFTEKLLQHMTTPGLRLEEVFKRVRADVQQDSNNKQVPWDSSSVTGDFFFVSVEAERPSAPTVSASETTPEQDFATEAWELVKDSEDPALLEGFVAMFPDAPQLNLAKLKLMALASREPRAEPSASQAGTPVTSVPDHPAETLSDSENIEVLSGEAAKKQLLEASECSGCDLRGANLRKAFLRGANLSKADLTGADLTGADLAGVDLNNVRMVQANLKGAETTLSGADLTNADLSGSNFKKANLTSVNFEDANLSGADLSNALLVGANFSRANLTGANLVDTWWEATGGLSGRPSANLTDAQLCRTTMPDGSINNRDCEQAQAGLNQSSKVLSGEAAKKKLLETKSCDGCDLNGVSLQRSNLTSANLQRANLRDANLYQANLGYAQLMNTNLQRVNLREADLFKIYLMGSNLSGADLRETDLREADLNGADLREANLTESDLTEANLENANLNGAKFCNTTMSDGSINNSNCDSNSSKEFSSLLEKADPQITGKGMDYSTYQAVEQKSSDVVGCGFFHVGCEEKALTFPAYQPGFHLKGYRRVNLWGKDRPWTDTELQVKSGDVVVFYGKGDVKGIRHNQLRLGILVGNSDTPIVTDKSRKIRYNTEARTISQQIWFYGNLKLAIPDWNTYPPPSQNYDDNSGVLIIDIFVIDPDQEEGFNRFKDALFEANPNDSNAKAYLGR